jgi:hypothetical protein
MDNTYNGWKNWETWQILLWADNDEATYKETLRFVRRFADKTDFPRKVEAWFRHLYPTGTPDMATYEELDAVDWNQIAQHLEEWND